MSDQNAASEQSIVLDQEPGGAQELAEAQPHELSSQPTQAYDLLQEVIKAAANPEVDIDRLDRLLVIRDNIMAQEAVKAYAGAMSKVQAKIGPIYKNKENSHTHSGYADLAAINATLIPVYTAEGFSLSFSNKASATEGNIVVMCDVMHSEGHTNHYEYDLPFDGTGTQGNTTKTAIHASASSVSYGQRYLTNMIFNIATFDDDGNAAGRQENRQVGITDDTVDKIQKGMEITGKSLKECLDFINGIFAAEYDRLTEMTEPEGLRLLKKLNSLADGDEK